MFIVLNIERVINRYLDDYKAGKINKPECCEICRRKCKLTWHAKYMRKLITARRIYDQIPIKRLFCPMCVHTFALIPEFIKKFCRYGKDIITCAVKEFTKRIKCFEIANKLADMMETVDIYIEVSTLYRWKKKLLTI